MFKIWQIFTENDIFYKSEIYSNHTLHVLELGISYKHELLLEKGKKSFKNLILGDWGYKTRGPNKTIFNFTRTKPFITYLKVYWNSKILGQILKPFICMMNADVEKKTSTHMGILGTRLLGSKLKNRESFLRNWNKLPKLVYHQNIWLRKILCLQMAET